MASESRRQVKFDHGRPGCGLGSRGAGRAQEEPSGEASDAGNGSSSEASSSSSSSGSSRRSSSNITPSRRGSATKGSFGSAAAGDLHLAPEDNSPSHPAVLGRSVAPEESECTGSESPLSRSRSQSRSRELGGDGSRQGSRQPHSRSRELGVDGSRQGSRQDGPPSGWHHASKIPRSGTIGTELATQVQSSMTQSSMGSLRIADDRSRSLSRTDDRDYVSESGSSEIAMNQHVDMEHMPLHLRDGRIRSEGEYFSDLAEKQDWGKNRRNRRLSFVASEMLKPDEEQLDPSPNISVPVQAKLFWVGIVVLIIWSLACISMLIIFVARYYTALRISGQSIITGTYRLKNEVAALEHLMQAISVIKSLAMMARSGNLAGNDDEVQRFLGIVLTPEMYLSPAIKYIQISRGLGFKTLLARPGTLRDSFYGFDSRAAYVYALANVCDVEHPVNCLGYQTASLTDAENYGVQLGWQPPEFVGVDDVGAALEPERWTLSHHVVGYANITTLRLPGPALLGFDVAIDVGHLSETLGAIQSREGNLFIVCTAEGVLLAATGWRPHAAADPRTGQVIYPKIWDLGWPWLDAVVPLQELRQAELRNFYYGKDEISISALQVGDLADGAAIAARNSLRVVVYTSFDSSADPILGQLAIAAIAFLCLPVSVAVLCCLVFFLYVIMSCLFRCCGMLEEYEDEDEAD